MNEIQIRVPDMSCGHCTAAVQNALEGVPGVSDVDVSLETKVAKIICDSTIELPDLMGTIQSVGYTPEPVS